MGHFEEWVARFPEAMAALCTNQAAVMRIGEPNRILQGANSFEGRAVQITEIVRSKFLADRVDYPRQEIYQIVEYIKAFPHVIQGLMAGEYAVMPVGQPRIIHDSGNSFEERRHQTDGLIKTKFLSARLDAPTP